MTEFNTKWGWVGINLLQSLCCCYKGQTQATQHGDQPNKYVSASYGGHIVSIAANMTGEITVKQNCTPLNKYACRHATCWTYCVQVVTALSYPFACSLHEFYQIILPKESLQVSALDTPKCPFISILSAYWHWEYLCPHQESAYPLQSHHFWQISRKRCGTKFRRSWFCPNTWCVFFLTAAAITAMVTNDLAAGSSSSPISMMFSMINWEGTVCLECRK